MKQDIKRIDTQHNAIQHCETQHNYIHHKIKWNETFRESVLSIIGLSVTALNIMKFSITRLNIMTFSTSINETRHKDAQHNDTRYRKLFMLISQFIYAECRYTVCRLAECRCAVLSTSAWDQKTLPDAEVHRPEQKWPKPTHLGCWNKTNELIQFYFIFSPFFGLAVSGKKAGWPIFDNRSCVKSYQLQSINIKLARWTIANTKDCFSKCCELFGSDLASSDCFRLSISFGRLWRRVLVNIYYEENVVTSSKSNLLLMSFCLHIINYNS